MVFFPQGKSRENGLVVGWFLWESHSLTNPISYKWSNPMLWHQGLDKDNLYHSVTQASRRREVILSTSVDQLTGRPHAGEESLSVVSPTISRWDWRDDRKHTGWLTVTAWVFLRDRNLTFLFSFSFFRRLSSSCPTQGHIMVSLATGRFLQESQRSGLWQTNPYLTAHLLVSCQGFVLVGHFLDRHAIEPRKWEGWLTAHNSLTIELWTSQP